MTLATYTFYLEFGNEKLSEEIEIDDGTPPWKIQETYERWRDEHLVCGWWNRESNDRAFRIMRSLAELEGEQASEKG